MKSIAIAALLIAAITTGAAAQTSPIEADRVWARATLSGARTAVVYMTLINKGHDDDRLVAVSTDLAGRADVHATRTENGVMSMRPVTALDVKPGAPTVLKPGGYHVMLMDLKEPLVAGQSFALSLTFEKAGKIDVTGIVEKADAMHSDTMPGMKQ